MSFTHFCGQAAIVTGAFIVWRITAKKRMLANLEAIKAELESRKHHRMSELGAWLRKVALRYYQPDIALVRQQLLLLLDSVLAAIQRVFSWTIFASNLAIPVASWTVCRVSGSSCSFNSVGAGLGGSQLLHPLVWQPDMIRETYGN